MRGSSQECETCARATSILVFIACVMTLAVGVMGLWTYSATHDLKGEIEQNRRERNEAIKGLTSRIDQHLTECR